MLKRLGMLLAIIGMTAGLALFLDGMHGQPGASSTPHNVEALPADMAPNVMLTRVHTGEVTPLQQWKGKTVWINFWASWCVPCVKELPMLLDAATRHPNDLVLVLLSGDFSEEEAQTFLQEIATEHGYMNTGDEIHTALPNVYSVWDKHSEIARTIFQTFRYPETIIINPDGTMKEKIVGMIAPEQLEALENAIKRSE